VTAVDVVMPVRDAMPFLIAAVESVRAQTVAGWRLLVVDDGSVDGGPDWCRDLRDPRVQVIRSRGRGISAALNTGIEVASAPYVARMDGDDLSSDTRLERQLERMACGDLVALGTSYSVIDASGHPIAVQAVPSGPTAVRAALARTNPFCHGSLLLRTEAIKRAGGYRDDFPLAEDYDLMLRLAALGDVDNLDAPLYSWRLSPASTSVRRPRRQAAQAARVRASARRARLVPRAPLRTRSADAAAPVLERLERWRPERPSVVEHRWRAGLLRGEGSLAAALVEYDALLDEHPLDLVARLRRRRTRALAP